MPINMNNIYAAPAFIVNLDRCKERLESSMTRVRDAGFLDVRRWGAIDASDKVQLINAWKCIRTHTSPTFDAIDQDFVNFPGKQGVYLSMLSLWQHIVDEKIPVATIFEDDVKFHQQWHTLAPMYMENTPDNYDIVFMGNQMDTLPPSYHICRVPVYCLHAYIITYEGAQKLLKEFEQIAPRTIDCILLDMMKSKYTPFIHYVWNGTLFPSPDLATSVIRRRNTGLVFQDEAFDSSIQSFNNV
jgi:GR25 family glycosyltransferase involved in LPS biosynthesis